MQIGQVIRKYRKRKEFTQEEMAVRLGVTAPAVNKWENGNSFPDIMLLAPIARLLDISVDTLVSFQEDLTTEEITQMILEVERKLKEEPYGEVFQWAKKVIARYPNCDTLLWQLAVILDAQRMVREIPDADRYEEELCSFYHRALESRDEAIRSSAAGSLFGFYLRKEQYEKAEDYLKYFSKENPERKRRQAMIYAETDRIPEAYQAYEELLFSDYQIVSGALHGMFLLSLKEKDGKKAHEFAKKQEELARCFEMGRYYEISWNLELAAIEKDADLVISTMQEMLSSVEHIGDFSKSSLYEHMKFKEIRAEFAAELKSCLLKCFRDEESYGFLKGDARWEAMVKEE